MGAVAIFQLGRLRLAMRDRGNWAQLAKFAVVGASGYAVNLLVYGLTLSLLHYLLAASLAFLVAASSNYLLNRVWTFRDRRGHVVYQGLRFLAVSTAALALNLCLLAALVAGGLGKLEAQALAIVLATPVNFLGNRLWSFR
jgi:putative flippase GtrA